MKSLDFIHPDDAAALNALEKIPLLPTIVKELMHLGAEQLQFGLNMATKVRLSPTQLPHFYQILPPICEMLGIKEPEFYLAMDPLPNAYAFGDTHTAITITSSLVEMMTEEELRAVVAHECGHIACRHMLYHTLAQVLANSTGMSKNLVRLAAPIHYTLMYWQRKSELSCDRVASFIAGPKAATSMLSRLAGGPKSITLSLNLVELAEQADLYDALCKSDGWNSTLQTYAVLDQNHPFTSVRIRELLKWTNSDQYKSLIAEGRLCPHCHQAIDDEWKFCQHCGKKL